MGDPNEILFQTITQRYPSHRYGISTLVASEWYQVNYILIRMSLAYHGRWERYGWVDFEPFFKHANPLRVSWCLTFSFCHSTINVSIAVNGFAGKILFYYRPLNLNTLIVWKEMFWNYLHVCLINNLRIRPHRERNKTRKSMASQFGSKLHIVKRGLLDWVFFQMEIAK